MSAETELLAHLRSAADDCDCPLCDAPSVALLSARVQDSVR